MEKAIKRIGSIFQEIWFGIWLPVLDWKDKRYAKKTYRQIQKEANELYQKYQDYRKACFISNYELRKEQLEAAEKSIESQVDKLKNDCWWLIFLWREYLTPEMVSRLIRIANFATSISQTDED